MYTGAPITHRIQNVGATPYRMFTVENLRDKGWATSTPIEAPGTKVVQQSRAFVVYDITLTAAAPQTMHEHENPTFTAVVSGTVEVQGGGGEEPFKLTGPGRWFPSFGEESPHTITALGGDAHLIDVELR
jgi:hypothetical protein